MKRVLVIDDDKIIRILLTKLLQMEGFEVIFAESGAQGLKTLKDEEVDVILMDYTLGGMTALDLLEIMKSNQIEKPVIILSAFDKSELSKSTSGLGVKDVIQKPFTNQELIEKVKRIVN
jgi:DNA-binding response OmpR family regulator